MKVTRSAIPSSFRLSMPHPLPRAVLTCLLCTKQLRSNAARLLIFFDERFGRRGKKIGRVKVKFCKVVSENRGEDGPSKGRPPHSHLPPPLLLH